MNIRQLQHLAAAMAHEVRNPLNAMAIHLELLESRLKREPGERAAVMKSLGTLQGEIERIDRVLEEYLGFAGPEETPRQPIDPAQLVAASVERVQELADARGVTVEVVLPKPLDRWVLDAEGVGEALDALLSNAIEASPRGATVTVTVQGDADEGELTVSDRGEGIPAEDLPRLFQLGFSRRKRAGIGLTVAKQIVKGQGGSISAESQGVGASFRIRLPIEPEA